MRDMTGRTRNRLTRAALVATLIALVSVAPAGSAPAAPVAVGPDSGAVLAFLPAFSWSGVSGADRYEFEISADSGFNSPVLGSNFDHFFTKNTHATINKSVPNGTYWWHVRSVASDGSLSPWSSARSFQKLWLIAPTLTAPLGSARSRQDVLLGRHGPRSGRPPGRLLRGSGVQLGLALDDDDERN